MSASAPPNSLRARMHTSQSGQVDSTNMTAEGTAVSPKGRHKVPPWVLTAMFVCVFLFLILLGGLSDTSGWTHTHFHAPSGLGLAEKDSFARERRAWHQGNMYRTAAMDATETLPVTWMAPVLSGGGYCSEALSFIQGLSAVPNMRVAVRQHGDAFNKEFVHGLPDVMKQMLQKTMHTQFDPASSIYICHSEPGAWHPAAYSTAPCPPEPELYQGTAVTIGRTMFETDTLPSGWADKLNRMDAVWVPTEFHRDVFVRGGVNQDKLVVVPESVDTAFFDPTKYRPDFAFPIPDKKPKDSPQGTEAAAAIVAPDELFKFLSIFKFEHRKGWQVLVEAFVREFTVEDKVVLYILTSSYHSDGAFEAHINAFVHGLGLAPIASLPPIRLLPSGIPQQDMPKLYKSVQAFVLPSRGEGWGRPHVEAMSMGLPVIATWWSGPSAFMTQDNSFPLSNDGLEDINNEHFPGHKWASPSLSHLMQLMRQVASDPVERERRGKQARKDMQEKWCIECVTRIVFEQLNKYRLANRTRSGPKT